MVKIGDVITRELSFGDMKGEKIRMTGRVVYVHPEERYYTAEFEFPRGRTICESFPLRNRIVLDEGHEKPGPKSTGARFAQDAEHVSGRYAPAIYKKYERTTK